IHDGSPGEFDKPDDAETPDPGDFPGGCSAREAAASGRSESAHREIAHGRNRTAIHSARLLARSDGAFRRNPRSGRSGPANRMTVRLHLRVLAVLAPVLCASALSG